MSQPRSPQLPPKATGALPANNNASLFIEVQLHAGHTYRQAQITSMIEEWLKKSFSILRIGQVLSLQALKCASVVKTVRVAGISRCSKLSDDACCLLSDHNLAIRLYTLHSNRDDDSSAVEDDDAAGGRLYSLTRLPHEDLDGKWESLVFDEPIGETTLRALSQAMINGRRSALHTALGNWQHTVLLHGPCGTGKTTLAQALAQKLCIRLSSIFDNATLLHVNAHSLFTRFFGESAKNVGRLFNDILELSSQEDRLLIVIFDEVETLASCRQTSLQGNEVADSMRSTNELLTGLDRTRGCSNVVFIFTTNLLSLLDAAFVDRCRIKKHFINPTVKSSSRMLRKVVDEYIKVGLVQADDGSSEESTERAISSEASQDVVVPSPLLPGLAWEVEHLSAIAIAGQGLSFRKWHDLVALAWNEYIANEPCQLSELLEALFQVVQEEMRQRGELPGDVQTEADVAKMLPNAATSAAEGSEQIMDENEEDAQIDVDSDVECERLMEELGC